MANRPDITAGRGALSLAQSAAANVAQIGANTHKQVTDNLKGVGEAIRDYAAFKTAKEKELYERAFKQKEFDTKNAQFDAKMAHETAVLDEQKRQFDENAPVRAAQASNYRANAYLHSQEARSKKNVNDLEEKIQKEKNQPPKQQTLTPSDITLDDETKAALDNALNAPKSKLQKGFALLGGVKDSYFENQRKAQKNTMQSIESLR